MLAVLIGVHRAAERDHRLVLEWIARWSGVARQEPGVEVCTGRPNCIGEHSRPALLLANDGEDTHLAKPVELPLRRVTVRLWIKQRARMRRTLSSVRPSHRG